MATQAVSTRDLIDMLVNFNTTVLDRVIALMEKIQSDLMNDNASAQVDGEIEELLRMILDTGAKAVETLLSLQEQLQTRIVESYFPAQD